RSPPKRDPHRATSTARVPPRRSCLRPRYRRRAGLLQPNSLRRPPPAHDANPARHRPGTETVTFAHENFPHTRGCRCLSDRGWPSRRWETKAIERPFDSSIGIKRCPEETIPFRRSFLSLFRSTKRFVDMLAFMVSLLSAGLSVGALLLAAPAVVFTSEVLASYLPRSQPSSPPLPASFRMAVLVPAHDEAAGIAETVRHLVAQLGPRDRLVVIADNCSDDTARLAQQAG